MVLLYSISKELSISALTFDLFWGYPPGDGCDFLDGSCILYTGGSNSRPYHTFDYHKRQFADIPDMSHSGDVMDNYAIPQIIDGVNSSLEPIGRYPSRSIARIYNHRRSRPLGTGQCRLFLLFFQFLRSVVWGRKPVKPKESNQE